MNIKHVKHGVTLREEHRLGVFDKRVLREIFGPKKGEVTGEWRILHNQDLCDLYISPNVIRVISSRTMRWAGHVACMVDRIVAYSILGWGDVRERHHLEDLGVDGKVI
jgi:hypothetical protein